MDTSTSQEEYIFTTSDPLNQIVYLTEERMQYISKHVEMIGEEDKIKENVENPDYIFADAEFSTNHCYYREHKDIMLKPRGKFLKVVVDRDLQGQVITAYPTPNIKKGETIIYKKDDENGKQI